MALEFSPFIKGIHFFCDHRCWRCPLSHRCRVFARVSERPSVPPRGGPSGRVAAVILASMQVTLEETSEALRGVAVDLELPAASTDGEIAALAEHRDKVLQDDPLIMRGKEYAEGTLRVARALRPRLKRVGDAQAEDACDRLEETCLTVASKIFRATSSRHIDSSWADAPQDDANGSAKVALLLIEESRQAWRLLAAPGRSFGNGAPRRFIVLLEILEAGILERFPDAFSFVRPGFDTGEADSTTTQIARALLASVRPGNA